MLNLNEREQAIKDIEEEIDVVLSIKDFISEEEIKNFTEGFKALSERDIREVLVKITGDLTYIDNYKDENEITPNNEDNKNENIVEEQKVFEEEKVVIEDNKLLEENVMIVISNTSPEVEEIRPISEDISLMAEDIRVIREEVRYNQLCIEWDWPNGVNKVLVCYKNDKFPIKPEDKECNKFTVEKQLGEKTGEFIINKLKEESYYFWVFPIVNENGNIKYLEGKKRLVVNKAVGEIYYELKVKKSLLGAVKSVKVFLKTDVEELTLPPTVLIAKKGSVPIFKSDGNEICRFDYTKIGKDMSVEIEVPLDKISKNTYVKLFIEDEKSSGLFRLIPPHKEKMYL